MTDVAPKGLPLDRIVFWQTQSAHTEDMIRTLSEIYPDTEVISCAPPGPDGQRRLWDWSSYRPGRVREIRTVDASQQNLISSRHRGTVHIVSGTGRAPLARSALTVMRRERVAPIILSEPRAFEGVRGIARYAHSVLTEAWLRRHALAVLAVGMNGPSWFRRVGYAPERIFDFAYFVRPLSELSETLGRIEHRLDARFEVGYVGRFVSMKGVCDLLEALEFLEFECRLTLVGAGPLDDQLRLKAVQSPQTVRVLGRVAHTDLGSVVGGWDCSVLPSRTMDDGWGVAVSEALMEGVPAVATRQVGSSILLRSGDGSVARARAPVSLAGALTDVRRRRLHREALRGQRAIRARQALDHVAGAEYLGRLLQHLLLGGPRPSPYHQTLTQGD